MTSRAERIKATLDSVFYPILLDIKDESHRHARHAARQDLPAGETHYRLELVSTAFAGQSRVARQRAVNEALATEFSSGLHALSMTLRTPEEASTP